MDTIELGWALTAGIVVGIALVGLTVLGRRVTAAKRRAGRESDSEPGRESGRESDSEPGRESERECGPADDPDAFAGPEVFPAPNAAAGPVGGARGEPTVGPDPGTGREPGALREPGGDPARSVSATAGPAVAPAAECGEGGVAEPAVANGFVVDPVTAVDPEAEPPGMDSALAVLDTPLFTEVPTGGGQPPTPSGSDASPLSGTEPRPAPVQSPPGAVTGSGAQPAVPSVAEPSVAEPPITEPSAAEPSVAESPIAEPPASEDHGSGAHTGSEAAPSASERGRGLPPPYAGTS